MSSRRNNRHCRIGLLLAQLFPAIACEPADADTAYDTTGGALEEFAAFAEPGAEDEDSSRPCITPEEYEVLFAEVARNTAALGLDGLSPDVRPRAAVQFEWPLRQVGAADPGYHAITNYVDHAGPGEVLDLACGTRTYDGHRGIDISLWPFPWLKVENSEIEVLAAAPGTIVSRADGNFDRRCSWISGARANFVALRHADGSTSYYYHMKSGSVTNKQVGDTVVTGERLGVAASSGVSTGPHLHFEVRDGANNVVDPFVGACNPTITETRWVSPRPYHDPAIVKLTTGSAAPEIPACPEVEEPHLKHQFCRGDLAVFTAFFRDLLPGVPATMVVRRPDTTVALQWQLNVSRYLTKGYYWKSWQLPADAPAGTWSFEATYSGQTFSQSFTIAKKGKACATNQ
ncbi:peptidoglycan DD-metalloendopeptidase family protein [Nannocystis sp. SCPEA4]|uniref:M23 family metallopeptidase n=1 Tax=Nannocystis sp. SCPEA4 TaxID=2996787 RepID=UPI00226F4867|nr:peptidoglycan DD-metalloendopeptidase family protein [Nannocystis sp. SCPEA4]MCY1060604.1 peptidoglycan DD-metalloendopeptidase family protein [Nannocystis sp. SCPEA4]